LKRLGAYSERQRNGNIAVLDPQQGSRGAVKHQERANGEVYLSAIPVELYPFDESYMELLRRGDNRTQEHFVSYFGKLLRIKLRSRKLPVHVIQDVQQETFLRVLVAVRTSEVRHPERLGAYVNSVCRNILLEHYRLLAREQHVELDAADGPDAAADLEARIIADERTQSVHVTLSELPQVDAEVLRGVLGGRDKDEVCRSLSVTREYLRVLTHRAIRAFKDRHKKRKGAHGTSQAPKR
jgi:RNA polymerase sigma-70 factor (ECF subfamily)